MAGDDTGGDAGRPRVSPPILPPGYSADASGTICVPKTETEPTDTTRAESNRSELDGEEFRPGDEVGGYRIREMIGRGGCGTVYAAENEARVGPVAVKILRLSLAGSSHQVRRFVQEAEALKAIDHPGIVEVYDTGTLPDGRPYFAMELLHGRSLAGILGERGRFAPAEALEVLTPICEMLELAHQAGIVHRDIKASNIMIVSTPTGTQVKLLDFGLAKLINSEQSGSMQTSIGVVLGTLHSMAPEQILSGTVDGRTDIYALGALLHRLLTGRHPFEDIDNQKVARMHLSTPPPLPSLLAPVSPALDAVVRRAMDKDPNHRYPTAYEFLAALRDAVDGRAAGHEGRAVGIYVEGRIAEDTDLDDGLLERLMAILDRAEGALHAAGFQIVLQTTTAILGARLLSDDALPMIDQPLPGGVEDAGRVASNLALELAELRGADTRIHINICLHSDRAVLHTRGKQARIAGGTILDVDAWAPQVALQGVRATRRSLGVSADERSYIEVNGP